MTFAAALRAMLRQAPNIVMVGEIRDLETAEIAINASLTGHMVFSTLHTNDAPGRGHAPDRHRGEAVPRFHVAPRVSWPSAWCARSARHCKRPYDAHAARSCARSTSTRRRRRRPTFCQGRRLLPPATPRATGDGWAFSRSSVNDEIQKMIYEGAGSAAPNCGTKARSNGMRTMREDGARKVIAGLTTIEEVVSITWSATRVQAINVIPNLPIAHELRNERSA
jgi:type IV pilus assembly protein PilB